MKLKVCGINNADFAVKAAELGVDYLGFIFHPASPRNVTIEQAKAISKVVPRCVSPEQPSEATQPQAAGNSPVPTWKKLLSFALCILAFIIAKI